MRMTEEVGINHDVMTVEAAAVVVVVADLVVAAVAAVVSKRCVPVTGIVMTVGSTTTPAERSVSSVIKEKAVEVVVAVEEEAAAVEEEGEGLAPDLGLDPLPDGTISLEAPLLVGTAEPTRTIVETTGSVLGVVSVTSRRGSNV